MSLDTSSPGSGTRPATAQRVGQSDAELDRRRPLPAWPLAWLLVATPLWWLLGTIDFVIVPIAVVMVYYLRRTTHVRVPRGFAIWLIFLFFMLASGIEITKFNSYFTFAYRAGIYLGSTVVFVYVYNSRRWIPDRKVLQYLVWYLVTMTAGGFLGAVKPIGQFRTPMYYVLAKASPFLVNNDLVRVMVVRPFSQYDPTNYFQIPPRPTAPFIFTNNWGNAYSMVLPLVLIYFLESPKRSWQRRLSGLLLPVSAVPAMLTLNRGMFIGLGIIAVYVGLRLAARGYLGRVVLSAAVAGGVGLVLWKALNVSAGLHTRVEASTDTRASLYDQALHSVQSSPLFGYGVTIQSTSTNPWDPKVGTQGQFWMVLISHGVIATACFVGFFLVAVVMTFRRRDFAGMVCNAVVLAGVIETIYYGLVPYGLPLLMIAAALAWRPPPVARSRLSEAEPGVPRP
jgi:hypothetical protein